MNEVFKIYPTIEELSSVSSEVQCSQADCKAVFRSSSNLNMHLLKHHKIETDGLSKKNQTCEFYCPVKTCVYHKDSKKCFEKLKYLKQHFLKVHATKTYECITCKKKFATEAFRNLHMKSCGKFFSCTCGATYNSSEAILTHCKRKGVGHGMVQRILSKRPLQREENHNGAAESKCKRLIYPKLSNDSMSFPIHYIAAIALSELSIPSNLSKSKHVAVQTDNQDFRSIGYTKTNHCLKALNKKRKSSRQTQTTTGKNKNLKISAETQTSGNYLKSKQKHYQKLTMKKRKKSMETQTKEQAKFVTSCKSLKFGKGKNDNVLGEVSESKTGGDDKWIWSGQLQEKEKNSESQLTVQSQNELLEESHFPKKQFDASLNRYNDSFKNRNFYSNNSRPDQQMFDINRLCNIETQTEMDSFLTECSEDTSFTLCSTTETQTTDDFESLLYSNMCTQTSEDVDQLFDFNFVDIETQTAWPDLSD